MATEIQTTQSFGGLLVRAGLPCLILLAGWFGYSKLSVEVASAPRAESKKRNPRTRVEEIAVTDYPVRVKTYGIVQAHDQVTLSAEISGTVTKVSPSFEAGAYFSAGEVLVEIDARNYVVAVSMAKSRLLAAQSALQLAQLNEQRKLRLVESNAVSRAEVDAASATREQAEADVDLAAAQLEQAELDVTRTKVVAPFNGRMQTKEIGLGQMAGPNTPLGQIFAVDYAEVRLPISARQRDFLALPEFTDDPAVEVELRDSINQASPALWRAKIIRTEGVLDIDSRDLYAIARINDPFGRHSEHPPLRIGQPVVASIGGITLRDVIALPRNAVRQLDKVILVHREELTLLPVTVTALWSDAEHVIVDRADIPAGMLLATTPMVITPTGAKVDIIPDAMPTTTVAETSPTDSDSSATQ
jgi:RND family efflux transporter MFP subunit